MTYEELEKGLARLGFVGIDGIDSCGKCHLDNKHYILTTDGCVIYSSIPHYTNVRHLPNEIDECWGMEEFTWEKLEEVMNIKY